VLVHISLKHQATGLSVAPIVKKKFHPIAKLSASSTQWPASRTNGEGMGMKQTISAATYCQFQHQLDRYQTIPKHWFTASMMVPYTTNPMKRPAGPPFGKTAPIWTKSAVDIGQSRDPPRLWQKSQKGSYRCQLLRQQRRAGPLCRAACGGGVANPQTRARLRAHRD
jgi:hypothetical protein